MNWDAATITTIIIAILGSGGIGSFLGAIINAKSSKKKNDADAYEITIKQLLDANQRLAERVCMLEEKFNALERENHDLKIDRDKYELECVKLKEENSNLENKVIKIELEKRHLEESLKSYIDEYTSLLDWIETKGFESEE